MKAARRRDAGPLREEGAGKTEERNGGRQRTRQGRTPPHGAHRRGAAKAPTNDGPRAQAPAYCQCPTPSLKGAAWSGSCQPAGHPDAVAR